MPDSLRRQVSALWLFHGATIERSLELADLRLAEVEHYRDSDDEEKQAAGVERERVKAALVAFRELGEELQK